MNVPKTHSLSRLFCLILLLLAGAFTDAHATHLRFGHITWKPRPDIGPSTVEFDVSVGYRASYFGRTQVGQTFSHTGLYYGDGTHSGNLVYTVIAYNAAEDWVIGRRKVVKTYSAQKHPSGVAWQVEMSVCCRISTLRNSNDTTFIARAAVDISQNNASPVSSLPAIVTCGRGATCSFIVPTVDDNKDVRRFRLATTAESGIRQNPAGLTISSDTGIVTWPTTSSTALGLYAVQVRIEDLNAAANAKSFVVIDFLINLKDFVSSQPPGFNVPPTPVANQELTAYAGQPMSFAVRATDPDATDTVTLNHVGLPPGAQFTAVTAGNPAEATFTWTPQESNVGQYIVTFTAADNNGYSALPHSILLRVVKPKLTDVRVIDMISDADIDIVAASFSTPPTRVESVGGNTEVEWAFATFDPSQVAELDFDVLLKNSQPGEQRVVSHRVVLSYKDESGTLIRQELGERRVQVLASSYGIVTSTDQPVYRANETVNIATEASSLSQYPAQLSAHFSIRDAQGALIANLGSVPPFALPAAGTQTLPSFQFLTGQTLAGAYVVRVELLDLQGAVVAVATAPFDIRHGDANVPKASLRVTTDRPTYHTTDRVDIDSLIANITSNTILDNAKLRLRIKNSAGIVLFVHEGPLGQLTPGALRNVLVPYGLNNFAVGSYQIEGEVIASASGEILAAAFSQYQVIDDLAKSLTGSVSVAAASVDIGTAQVCTYTVANHSAYPQIGVPLRLSVGNLNNGATIETATSAVDLVARGTQTLVRDVVTGPLTAGDYACALEVLVNGSYRSIGYATFKVTEPIRIVAELSRGTRGRLLVLLDNDRCQHQGEHEGEQDNERTNAHARSATNSSGSDDDNAHTQICVTDPFGPASAPTLATQRAFLAALLTEAGWSYTITDTAATFTQEMNSGNYHAYALFAEREKLSETAQKYLREAVFSGQGLLVAGPHDARNLHYARLNHALAIKPLGHHTHAIGVDLIPNAALNGHIAVLPGEAPMRIKNLASDLVGRYLLGASSPENCDDDDDHHHDGDRDDDRHHASRSKTAAAGNNDHDADHDPEESHDREGCRANPTAYADAITLNNYGQGHAAFAALDLLANATASGAQSLPAQTLTTLLQRIAPTSYPTDVRSVVPLDLILGNRGIATPIAVTLPIPAGVSVIDAPGAVLTGNTLTWSTALAVGEDKTLRLYVKLPDSPGTIVFAADIAAPKKADAANASLTLTVAEPKTLTALKQELQTLIASGHPDRQALRQAQTALDRALQHFNPAHAVADALKACDRLRDMTDPAIVAWRLDLDRWIGWVNQYGQ